MASTSDLDVLRLVAADPAGMVGEELLHELGFDGTEAALTSAVAKGWLVEDSDGVYRATQAGQNVLDPSR